MLEIREKKHEEMVTIPIGDFVELIEKSARLDMFYQIINLGVVYTNEELLKLLSNEKSPAADQSNAGLDENNFD